MLINRVVKTWGGKGWEVGNKGGGEIAVIISTVKSVYIYNDGRRLLTGFLKYFFP